MRHRNVTNAARRFIATTKNTGRRVAVIGGGPGGLSAALAFARQGAGVSLHEQAPELRTVGAGIQLTPNGLRPLVALGLRDRLDSSGVAADAVVPTDGVTGRALARFDLTNQAPRYRFFHRADLIGALADAADEAGVTFHFGQAAQAEALDADVIVAADGIRSQHRSEVTGTGTAEFTGQVAWRAIIDRDAPSEARIWMLPGGHVVTYPLGQGRLNVVAVREEAEWHAEGWQHPSTTSDLLEAFPHVCSELRCILEASEAPGKWGLFRHPVARSWFRGRLCLLGDAAHPTLPFLAQGANLALEDAFVLARKTGEAEDLEDGLAAYQAARQDRVTRAIAAANANARNYHLSGIKRQIAHGGLRAIGRFAPDRFLARMSWLYGHDVTR